MFEVRFPGLSQHVASRRTLAPGAFGEPTQVPRRCSLRYAMYE